MKNNSNIPIFKYSRVKTKDLLESQLHELSPNIFQSNTYIENLKSMYVELYGVLQDEYNLIVALANNENKLLAPIQAIWSQVLSHLQKKEDLVICEKILIQINWKVTDIKQLSDLNISTQNTIKFVVYLSPGNHKNLSEPFLKELNCVCLLIAKLKSIKSWINDIHEKMNKLKSLKEHMVLDQVRLKSLKSNIQNCKEKEIDNFQEKINKLSETLNNDKKRFSEKEDVITKQFNAPPNFNKISIDTFYPIELEKHFSEQTIQIFDENIAFEVIIEDDRINWKKYFEIPKIKIKTFYSLAFSIPILAIVAFNFKYESESDSFIKTLPEANSLLATLPKYSYQEKNLIFETISNFSEDDLPEDTIDAFLDHPVIENYFDDESILSLVSTSNRERLSELLKDTVNKLQEPMGDDFFKIIFSNKRFSFSIHENPSFIEFHFDKEVMSNLAQKFGRDIQVFLNIEGSKQTKKEIREPASLDIKFDTRELCKMKSLSLLIKINMPSKLGFYLSLELPSHSESTIQWLKEESVCL